MKPRRDNTDLSYLIIIIFTSIALVYKLSSIGHEATAPMREDCIDMPELEDKALKKKKKGHI